MTSRRWKPSTCSSPSNIKAANVFVDTDGKAKLADYSYQLLIQVLLSNIAPDPVNLKKDFWIAPENLFGFGLLDFLSDIWAIGCLAFELCTGKPPFVDQIGWDQSKLRELHLKKGRFEFNRAAEFSDRHLRRLFRLHAGLPCLRNAKQTLRTAAAGASIYCEKPPAAGYDKP